MEKDQLKTLRLKLPQTLQLDLEAGEETIVEAAQIDEAAFGTWTEEPPTKPVEFIPESFAFGLEDATMVNPVQATTAANRRPALDRDALPTRPLHAARQAVAADRSRRLAGAQGRPELALGTVLAERYTIRSVLGIGGIAVVYRAFDSQSRRSVALKLLPSNAPEEQRRLFEREALLTSGFQHPNIVTVFDCGEHEGMPFLCMEVLEGMTAHELLQQHKPKGLPMAAVFQICEGVLEALRYAHQDNLIHRDVKPSNIMLTPRRQVKLMDFGTARVCEPGLRTTVAGTPAFMSPEQIKGEPLSHRADLFGFGVTMYQLLTGRLPFRGIERRPPEPPQLHRDIPLALSVLVMKCISLRPSERPVSATEALSSLRSCASLVHLPNRTEAVSLSPCASPSVPFPSIHRDDQNGLALVHQARDEKEEEV